MLAGQHLPMEKSLEGKQCPQTKVVKVNFAETEGVRQTMLEQPHWFIMTREYSVL